MANPRFPNRRPLLLSLTLVIVAAAILLPAGLTAAPETSMRITAAANVTVREMPLVTAAAVAQVPLGTEVTDAGPAGLDKTWVRVRLADGREGWLLSHLTKRLDAVWRWPVFDQIIADRLSRKGDGFAANAELLAFIERVAGEYTDRDGRARVELSRLRAMAAAVTAVPARSRDREPYASWLSARKDEVVWDPPAGQWMLVASSIWTRHMTLADTSVADDLAWFAVKTGLPGECEGFLSCYLQARDRQEGEYLRRHPVGRHAAEAVTVVKTTADLLAAQPKPRAAFEFDAKRDCRDLTKSIDALAAAVKPADAPMRDDALTSLATVRKRCA